MYVNGQCPNPSMVHPCCNAFWKQCCKYLSPCHKIDKILAATLSCFLTYCLNKLVPAWLSLALLWSSLLDFTFWNENTNFGQKGVTILSPASRETENGINHLQHMKGASLQPLPSGQLPKKICLSLKHSNGDDDNNNNNDEDSALSELFQLSRENFVWSWAVIVAQLAEWSRPRFESRH